MKITKHRTETPGVWSISVDGKPTDLTINKGEEKRWGDWQDWHLYAGDTHLMTERRAGDFIPLIERLLKSLGVQD